MSNTPNYRAKQMIVYDQISFFYTFTYLCVFIDSFDVQRPRTKDLGPRTKDQGPSTTDQGSRIKDLGPCFGTNGHPGLDTDVTSRLPKSKKRRPIILYWLYNGVTCIKDRGPCFGRNAHPGRDTDVISGLP